MDQGQDQGYVEPDLDPNYRMWRNLPPEFRSILPMNQQIVDSKYPIYGRGSTPQGLMPLHGPLSFGKMYPESADYGPEFDQEFNLANLRFRGLLLRIGYFIESNLTMGDPTIQFDNSIWVVKKVELQPDLYDIFGQPVDYIDLDNVQYYQYDSTDAKEYIAKIVSFRYVYGWTEGEPIIDLERYETAITKARKEADILYHLNHKNIMKVITVFVIESSTGFPSNLFTISIMEKMSGNVDDLKFSFVFTDPRERTPVQRFKLPETLIRGMIVQLGRALNYIHNEHASIGYALAHQAIRSQNILCRQLLGGVCVFKLADFEECIKYPMTQIQAGHPFDFNTPGMRPYVLETSAPEYIYARNMPDRWDTLRTFPNDVFQLGQTIIDMFTGGPVVRPVVYIEFNPIYNLYSYLHTQMGAVFPNPPSQEVLELLKVMTKPKFQQRITSAALVSHPYFLAIAQNIN